MFSEKPSAGLVRSVLNSAECQTVPIKMYILLCETEAPVFRNSDVQ